MSRSRLVDDLDRRVVAACVVEAREQPRLPGEGARQQEEAVGGAEEEPVVARGAEVAGGGISVDEAGRHELRVAEDRPIREREMHGRHGQRRRGCHGGCHRFRDHGGACPRSPAQVLPRRGAPVAADLAEADTVFPGTEAAQDEAEHVGTEITPAARDALLPDKIKNKKSTN